MSLNSSHFIPGGQIGQEMNNTIHVFIVFCGCLKSVMLGKFTCDALSGLWFGYFQFLLISPSALSSLYEMQLIVIQLTDLSSLKRSFFGPEKHTSYLRSLFVLVQGDF